MTTTAPPPLAHLLARLRALDDLPAVLAALGYAPAWEELPDGGLGAGPGVRAAVVGAAPGFRWFGVTHAARPRALLGRLVARGEIAGLLELDAGARRLTLAITADPTTRLSVDLAAPPAAAVATLERLAPAPGEAGLALAMRLARALATAAPDRRFLRAFRAALGRFTDDLPGRMPLPDRHALALLQLTRVLFLYFVQSKGWLDGRPDFLRREVDGCLLRRRHLQRDLLRPLFFGTLNRPREARRGTARRFGRIPFLNGGLFEPHPLERRWPVDLPTEAWRHAFDELFERFHFTVAEGHGGPAIAPDMLGRVFEQVMDPSERRASGTFYTPAALVTDVVDAALAAHVGRRLSLGDDRAHALIEAGDPRVAAALADLTLLDPAVGSGAFLLGALERLAERRRVAGAADGRAALRRDILRRCLFGVDLSATAVRLTELRLWLAVISEDPTGDADRVAPLPNLDCLIRQGDSLLDPLDALATLQARATRTAVSLGELRREVVAAAGQAKEPLVRALRRAELAILREALLAAEERAAARIEAVIAAARAPTLFGDPRGLDAELRPALLQARRQRRTARQARRRLESGHELPWFHYRSHFADVFARRGGFDIVIGNPPWVRAEQLPRAVRETLGQRYRWWRAGGTGPGFRHQPDLSLAFAERAHELAAPGGVVALLLPAKLAAAGYAATTRRALATEHTLHAVADLTSRQTATFDATVYPMAVVSARERPPAAAAVRTDLDPCTPATVAQHRLAAGPWVLVRDDRAAVLERLLERWPPLGARVTIHLGAKTGADRVFLDPPASVEPPLVRWALRGRDVAAFHARPRRRLLWPVGRDGRPLEQLPPGALAHLAAHDELLRGRADYRGGPPWTVFRTGAAARPHRVVWADLARELGAAALSGTPGAGVIPLNTCYVSAAATADDAHRLAAWLNTRWIRGIARLLAPPAAGGFRRFGADVVGRVPAPPALWTCGRLVAIGRTAAGAPGGTRPGELPALDTLAASVLELSAHEQDVLAAVDGDGADRRR